MSSNSLLTSSTVGTDINPQMACEPPLQTSTKVQQQQHQEAEDCSSAPPLCNEEESSTLTDLLRRDDSSTVSNGYTQDDNDRFRIGLVIFDFSMIDSSVGSMDHLVSRCRLDSIVILQDLDTREESETQLNEWLMRCRVRSIQGKQIAYGAEAYQDLLSNRPDIDAIYLIVPMEVQNKYILECLSASKHVLLFDPVSTYLQEFMEQLEYAAKYKRFVQFATMFVHQHRVRIFMGCVLREKQFGTIESIDAKLYVHLSDLDKVRVTLPLTSGQGCIRRLGRYCVLISALLLSRVGSRPISAQVQSVEVDPLIQEPMSADCVVWFSDNRVLTFSVGYSTTAMTRQVLTVRARDKYATMTDFVIPHRDGLATYRIYEKSVNEVTGQLEVESGEAVDVPSGPPQDVMMWRKFSELCSCYEADPNYEEVAELTKIALHTKSILNALLESYENNNSVVPVVEQL